MKQRRIGLETQHRIVTVTARAVFEVSGATESPGAKYEWLHVADLVVCLAESNGTVPLKFSSENE